ncbi:MAG: AMIN domain-containing protein [Desulfovibrio sp.]|jgi:hypothetical protein|nr:AMIN domain-containing protein [Desulfovibrio sp.]
MNKGIAILLLFVVLGAMGLVMFSHLTSRPDKTTEAAVPKTTYQYQSGVPQTSGLGQSGAGRINSSSDLIRIDPPLSSLDTPQKSLPEGAPKPVTLIAGAQTTRPASEIPPPDTRPEHSPPEQVNTAEKTETKPVEAPPAPKTEPAKPQAPTNSISASPGLTPWENPPKTAAAPGQSASPAQKGKSENPAPRHQDTSVAPTTPSKPPAQPAAPTPPSAPPTVANMSEKGTHALKNIDVHLAGNNVILRIEADNSFPCKTFTLSGPDRLVIDLPGTWKGMKNPSLPGNRLIRSIRIGQQSAGPRLVLDLNAALKNHKVERRDNVVEIIVVQ